MSLVADFSISINEGYSPLSITFTSTSTGSPTYYQWNFGDGDSSNDVGPTHTYIKPGIYSPVLEIRNGIDFDFIIKTNYIIINAPYASSENTIIESYQANSSKDWKFYIDDDLYLVFDIGGEIYKSGVPSINIGVWTLVEFHPGENQFYVSVVGSGRKKMPTYKISAGVTGMHIEDKLVVAPNSSMKIDELRAVRRDDNLIDYFRSLQSTVYYLE